MSSEDYKVYRKSDRTNFSARKTAFDTTGMSCLVLGEQYKRDHGDAIVTEPTLWGLKHAKTGKLSRLARSRDVARSMRKPTERVVAIWV